MNINNQKSGDYKIKIKKILFVKHIIYTSNICLKIICWKFNIFNNRKYYINIIN